MLSRKPSLCKFLFVLVPEDHLPLDSANLNSQGRLPLAHMQKNKKNSSFLCHVRGFGPWSLGPDVLSLSLRREAHGWIVLPFHDDQKIKGEWGGRLWQSSLIALPPVNSFPSPRPHLLNVASFTDISMSNEEAVSSWPVEDRSDPEHSIFHLPGVYYNSLCTRTMHWGKLWIWLKKKKNI